MRSKAKQQIHVWAWVWIPALLLASAVIVTQGPLSLLAQTQADERADPLDFKPGTLDENAVVEAMQFREYPIVWLGEEFHGYKLTSVVWEQYALPGTKIVVDRVNLVYGSCDRARDESYCTPPLALVVFAPGSVPGPADIPEEEKSTVSTKRGLAAAAISGSTIMWADGGVAIQVQSNQDLRDEIIESLGVANGNFFGIDGAGPGESLAPLRNVKGAR